MNEKSETEKSISVERKDTGYHFYVNGNRLPIILTLETPKDQAEKFLNLLQQNGAEAELLVKEYETKLAWNQNPSNVGQDWPIFNKMDRFLSRLTKASRHRGFIA